MNANLNFIALGLIFLSLILDGFCLAKLRSLEKLRAIFFAGSGGKDLEDIIRQLATNQEKISAKLDALNKELADTEHRLSFAAQKIGVVRFNPFADGGGNFSFCLALLDNLDNGVVITSMHGREQNRIYAKKIIAGQADSTLTEEEQNAIQEAISQHNKKLLKN